MDHKTTMQGSLVLNKLVKEGQPPRLIVEPFILKNGGILSNRKGMLYIEITYTITIICPLSVGPFSYPARPDRVNFSIDLRHQKNPTPKKKSVALISPSLSGCGRSKSWPESFWCRLSGFALINSFKWEIIQSGSQVPSNMKMQNYNNTGEIWENPANHLFVSIESYCGYHLRIYRLLYIAF